MSNLSHPTAPLLVLMQPLHQVVADVIEDDARLLVHEVESETTYELVVDEGIVNSD